MLVVEAEICRISGESEVSKPRYLWRYFRCGRWYLGITYDLRFAAAQKEVARYFVKNVPSGANLLIMINYR